MSAAIRAAIVTVLGSVPEIGVVHDYERYATNQAGMKSLYFSLAHEQIRGWFVRQTRIEEAGRIDNCSVEYLTWQINGLMGLNDELQTEKSFADLIEAVRDAFRADETLGGVITRLSRTESGEFGIQQDDSGPVMFADVLCHAARLRLTTVRFIDS